MGFSRQEYCSGLPCAPPGDHPDSGIEPTSLMPPALAACSLPLSYLGSPNRLHLAEIFSVLSKWFPLYFKRNITWSALFVLGYFLLWGFPGGASGKESVCLCRRHKSYGFDSGWGRSTGEGNGSPLQYSCLGKFHGQRRLVATVHGVTKSQTWVTEHIPSLYYVWGTVKYPCLTAWEYHREVLAWKVLLTAG